MKKHLSLILALILAVSLIPVTTLAANIGDVVGYAQPTDIIATINGYKIESYNVNDYTYICVEDLRYYGFDVYYDNATRTLSFNRSGATYIDPTTSNPNYHRIGSSSMRRPILYTDIVTYANGTYTPASNINGQTIINFNSLSQFGGVSYDNNKREISLEIYGLNKNTAAPSRPAVQTPTYTPQTPSVTGSSAYDIVKNLALTKGERNDDGSYAIYEINPAEGYGFLTGYRPSTDSASLFFAMEADDVSASVLISFEKDKKPGLYFTLEGGGYEFALLGEFPNAYTPYRELKSDFPYALEESAKYVLDSSLQLMDLLSIKSTGTSLRSLGIYYTPVVE